MLICTSTKYKPKRKPKKMETGLAPKFKPLARGDYKPTPVPFERFGHKHIPSASAQSEGNTIVPVQYNAPELQERELLAKKEAERRKKMLVPLHKSSYVYIGSGQDSELLRGLNKNSAL